MQQAAVILQVEDSMPRLHHFYDNQYISKHCSPLGEACDNISVSSCYHHEFGQVTGQVRVGIRTFPTSCPSFPGHDGMACPAGDSGPVPGPSEGSGGSQQIKVRTVMV